MKDLIEKILRNPKTIQKLNGTTTEWQLDDSGTCITFAGVGVLAEALSEAILINIKKRFPKEKKLDEDVNWSLPYKCAKSYNSAIKKCKDVFK